MNLVFFALLGLLLIFFQDVDLLSLAESALSKPSPTLFKIKDEITKNNPEFKTLEKPRAPTKDMAKFKLFIGKFSNTADRNGGGKGEEFDSLEKAMNAAKLHMSSSAGSQPSFRIEDLKGKVLKAKGVFTNIE